MKSRPLGRAPLDAIDPSLQVPTYLMLSTTGCRQSLQTVPIAATDRACSMTTASPEPTMRPCPAKRDSIVVGAATGENGRYRLPQHWPTRRSSMIKGSATQRDRRRLIRCGVARAVRQQMHRRLPICRAIAPDP